MGPLEELDMCLEHSEEHTELAPDSPLEIPKDKKPDEEAGESRRETASLGPLPEFVWTKNECSTWTNVGPTRETERAGVMASGSSQEGHLKLEQTSAK